MKNLVLIGFMGTGKSVVSKLLAQKLNRSVIDTDDLIEAAEKKTISDIFSQDGEQYFREFETKILKQLACESSKELVVSTGGGIVLRKENWFYMHQLGWIVCLTATPKTILKRVGKAQGRPLLQGSEQEVWHRINQLLLDRKGAYEQADIIIETDDKTPEQVTQIIVDEWSTKK